MLQQNAERPVLRPAVERGGTQDGGAAPHDDGEALSVQLGPSHAYAVEREEGEKEEQ